MSAEKSSELFRAILAASTPASIGGGFIGVRVHRAEEGGPIGYQWQFADGTDETTARAHVQIMLDKAVRPFFEGGRWRPTWI